MNPLDRIEQLADENAILRSQLHDAQEQALAKVLAAADAVTTSYAIYRKALAEVLKCTL